MTAETDLSDGSWSLCPSPLPEMSARYVNFVSRFGATQMLQFGFGDAVTDIAARPFRDVRRVLLFIPGNPGSITMYRHFLTRVHQTLQIPVIGLSHVGMIREGIHRFREPLTVRKLVEHKVDFIENVIPEDVEIILMGHSIGTFISMQVMRLIEKRERVRHCFMLMPVLEKFSQTPGWKSLRIMLYFRSLLYILVMILSLLKDEIVVRLMPHVIPELKQNKTPECMYEGILQLVNWRVIRNMLTLSRDECTQVQDRDDYFLHKNLDKFSLFYCVDDHWAPLSLYRGLKRRFPNCYTDLLDSVTHAFVMDKKMTEDVVSKVFKRYVSLTSDKGVDTD